MEVLPNLAGRGSHGDILPSAIKALGVSILNRDPGQRTSSYECFQAYCSALQRLKKGLMEAGSFHVESAAAIMCLTLAEVRMTED